jgi:hypothetical protein
MAGLLDYITEAAKAQYAKGAPYRNALGGLLSGDMTALQELNKPSPVMPNEALDVAMTFAPMGITAWHGSPYRFDKFDPTKIGSGEGAQAYGHGLYFAENPKVAQSYANIEPAGEIASPRRTIFGKEVEPRTPEYKAAQLVDELGLNKAKKFVNDWVKNSRPDELNFSTNINNILSSVNKKSDVKNLGTSNLYKVDIPDTHIENMLNWDKPISQQNPTVMAAINKTKKSLTSDDLAELGGDARLLYGKDITPAQFLNTWEIIRGQPNVGETLLNQYGVKGVKYFDNPSRDAMKGTQNFVVFDPNIVKILERNKQPIK